VMAKWKPVCIYADMSRGKVFHGDRATECLYPEPQLPALPVSISKRIGSWERLDRSWISRGDCEVCPCHTTTLPLPTVGGE
jgi:hypothetical protein